METQAIINKICLVTGGTGSFGEVAVRNFLRLGASEVRILSRDEAKQEALRFNISSDRIKCYVGDVRDYDSVLSATSNVDFVFHAAALKQVPSCEFFPMEAVKTNVVGTDNVIKASIQNLVKNVVVLSTDKAVFPINSMGMSKALMEKIAISYSRRLTNPQDTQINITRYGNVMGSRGSVIPLMTSQIISGGPITVTAPEMTRFLMSLDESFDLVLAALEEGKQGEIFIKRSSAATIGTLVDALVDIFDYTGEIDIIGFRHGEKLFETLASADEMAKSVPQGNFVKIPFDGRSLNYSKYVDVGTGEHFFGDGYNSHNANRLDEKGVVELLRNTKGLIS